MRSYSKAEQLKSVKTKKPKTFINKISAKKKKRLAETGGEKAMFLEIWEERPHICIECGQNLREPKAHNFDHIVPKSKGEQYRLDKNNIQLLCFSCHFYKTSGLNYKGPNLD